MRLRASPKDLSCRKTEWKVTVSIVVTFKELIRGLCWSKTMVSKQIKVHSVLFLKNKHHALTASAHANKHGYKHKK